MGSTGTTGFLLNGLFPYNFVDLDGTLVTPFDESLGLCVRDVLRDIALTVILGDFSIWTTSVLDGMGHWNTHH